MPSRKDDRYNQLLRRLNQAERLATIAFAASGLIDDPDLVKFIRRFQYSKLEPSGPSADLEPLWRRIAQTADQREERDRLISEVQASQTALTKQLRNQLEHLHGQVGRIGLHPVPKTPS
jgi:hypothetical protein